MSANEPRAIVCLDQAWVKLMWVLEYLAEIGPGDLEEIDPDEAEAHQASKGERRFQREERNGMNDTTSVPGVIDDLAARWSK